MFGIGMPEMLLILAIALIVIGPKKLPDLAKSLGKALREFKKATSELKESIDLDSDIKEVRENFDDIREEVKAEEGRRSGDSTPKPPAAGSTQNDEAAPKAETTREANPQGTQTDSGKEKTDREGSSSHG